MWGLSVLKTTPAEAISSLSKQKIPATVPVVLGTEHCCPSPSDRSFTACEETLCSLAIYVALVEPSLCHEYSAGDFSTSSLVLQYSLRILQATSHRAVGPQPY